MTQLERILDEIQRLKKQDGWEYYSAIDALDMIEDYVNLEVKQSSLPSDVDEAAEEHLHTKYKHSCLMDEDDKAVIDDFIAAAEWMAGQGVTKEITIGTTTDKMVITVTHQTMDMLGVEIGDTVIVQIRKK